MNVLDEAKEEHRHGNLKSAVSKYKRYLEMNTGDANAMHYLAIALYQDGELEQAESAIDELLRQTELEAEVLANGATIKLGLKKDAEAEVYARKALEKNKSHFGALYNLGVLQERQGRLEESRAYFEDALRIRPNEKKTLVAIAGISERLKDWQKALDYSRGALKFEKDEQKIAVLTGIEIRSLLSQGKLISAIDALKSIKLKDERLQALFLAQLATALLDIGEVEQSLKVSGPLLERQPGVMEAHSNYLIAVQHKPKISPSELYEAHCQWAEKYAQPSLRRRYGNIKDVNRVLKIAFISPRFHEGPVATYLTPLLRAMDKKLYEAYLYDNGGYEDACTETLKELSKGYVRIIGLSDEEAEREIIGREIDILVDLAGHGPGNRLQLMSKKPAPVQISWLDYFCTTGTSAYDAIFTDPALSPLEEAKYYAEPVYYLEHGRICYEPPVNGPDIQDNLPKEGIVFCSYNRVAKLNAEVAEVWSKILLRLPSARLVLRASALAQKETREWIYERRFAKHGIADKRIVFQDYGSYQQALRGYNSVHCALDPFPFSGCATTCDALWMGVPVIAMEGSTMVGRQSSSILKRIGEERWIAKSAEEYVDIAVAMASAKKENAVDHRLLLRSKTKAGLCDKQRFAYAFQRALRELWLKWCMQEN